MSISKRLDKIEAKITAINKPIRAVFQCLDNPDLYYLNGRAGAAVTKQQAIDALQSDYTLFIVSYRKLRGKE